MAVLAALRAVSPQAFAWRRAPYEFVIDRPAIDLLTGGMECRNLLESAGDLEGWMSTWAADEKVFREERERFCCIPKNAS